jgi:hypothetical protein
MSTSCLIRSSLICFISIILIIGFCYNISPVQAVNQSFSFQLQSSWFSAETSNMTINILNDVVYSGENVTLAFQLQSSKFELKMNFSGTENSESFSNNNASVNIAKPIGNEKFSIPNILYNNNSVDIHIIGELKAHLNSSNATFNSDSLVWNSPSDQKTVLTVPANLTEDDRVNVQIENIAYSFSATLLCGNQTLNSYSHDFPAAPSSFNRSVTVANPLAANIFLWAIVIGLSALCSVFGFLFFHTRNELKKLKIPRKSTGQTSNLNPNQPSRPAVTPVIMHPKISPPTPPPLPQASNKCKNCGGENTPNAKFCKNCGKKL